MVAAVACCSVQRDKWIAPHLAVGTYVECARWTCITQPVRRTPLWPASWLPVLDKSRGSQSAEVQRVWEICAGRLQFMSWDDVVALDESLDAGDVSCAWLLRSSAEEALRLLTSICLLVVLSLKRALFWVGVLLECVLFVWVVP